MTTDRAGTALTRVAHKYRPDLDADAALADLWGDAAPAIIRVVRQASALTAEQAAALGDVTALALAAADNAAAWEAALHAAWDSPALDIAAWDANDAALHAAGVAPAAGVAAAAAVALAVEHLVGQHGLTQDHIETLLGPWIAVMGDPRVVAS